jgi:PilZ domain
VPLFTLLQHPAAKRIVMDDVSETPVVAQAKPRGKSRESIFLSANLKFEGVTAETAARIRNISAGGMMVDCSVAFAIGHRVVATIKNIGEVQGRVAWSVAPRMGIAFDYEVDPKSVRVQVGGTVVDMNYAPRSASPNRRPGLAIR